MDNSEAVLTERMSEIARCNRWSDRLEDTWGEIVATGSLALQVEFLPKFIASFDKLSRARRALQGLDAPVIVDHRVTDDRSPVSIDQEVEELARRLGLNDRPAIEA